MLQWSRVLSNAETVRWLHITASVGVLLQWSRVLSNAETDHDHRAHPKPGQHRFNGAAFSRTRKLKLLSPGTCTSAELLQWSRVLSNAETDTMTATWNMPKSFNGAAFSRTRKPTNFQLTQPPLSRLQWSRVLSNAETTTNSCEKVVEESRASMEPRSLERGNSPSAKSSAPTLRNHLCERQMAVYAISTVRSIESFASGSTSIRERGPGNDLHVAARGSFNYQRIAADRVRDTFGISQIYTT